MTQGPANNFLAGLLGSLCLFAVTSAQEADSLINVADVTPHLNYLASPDREGRDDWGKIESRDYIIGQFRSFGVKPLFEDGYIQTVPTFGDGSDDPRVIGQNVGGFVAGTDEKLKDEWIVVNAHYDHLGSRRGKVYPGADDNASGVAMLLEVARRFAAQPARRSVAFVSFDLEEHLLWGSRWFVAHPPMDIESVKFCLTADMIGRSLGGLEIPSVFVMGSERSPEVAETLRTVSVPDGLELARLGVDLIGVRSDYGPFYYRRIPFLFFSTGEHPDYHTPDDTLERLDIAKVSRISTVMNTVARSMADYEGEITYNGQPEPDLEEVRTIHRVTELLLEADATEEYELTDLQRLFVTQVRSKTAYVLRVGRLSDTERAWLKRTAQMMLYSVF